MAIDLNTVTYAATGLVALAIFFLRWEDKKKWHLYVGIVCVALVVFAIMSAANAVYLSYQ